MPLAQPSPSISRIPQVVPKVATLGVPSPTGGWNARDSLDTMDAADAVSLINWFPNFGKVSRRNGWATYATGLGGPVKTLAEFDAASSRKFIAAANGKIFDVSSPGAVGAALATGFASDAWQTATFQNAASIAQMILVNGVDAPQIYDGSTVAGATISGSGLTTTNLLGATVFKTRVFYWENASQNLWYSASGAIAGALTKFQLGELSGFGGNVQSIATWTRDGGSGPDDYCVILMTTGDILMYAGTDISQTSTWALVGFFHIGSPVGTRCWAKLGPDVAIINKDGFVPLSQVMPGLWNPQEALSNKITQAAQAATAQYHDNFGWQCCLFPIGNMAIFNVPLSSTTFNQFVLNTATGSWCKFTNMNGSCWCLFNDDPYFGGTDGNVYQFYGSTSVILPGQTKPILNLRSDNGGVINLSGQSAWNYFGDRTRLKRMMLVRPAFSSDQQVPLGLALGVDFRNPQGVTPTQVFVGGGTPWNTSPWGSPWGAVTKTYLPRTVATGVGNCFSLTMSANIANADLDWFNVTYQYEPGLGI